MKSIIMGAILLASATSFAGVTLDCKKSFGNAVYTKFTLQTEIDDTYGLPYDLEEIVGTTVILDGKINKKHDDYRLDEEDKEWSFVTLGKRESVIEKGSEFQIETCKDCDYNGATYKYVGNVDGEVFITELYGSDSSGEFSVYTCKKK